MFKNAALLILAILLGTTFLIIMAEATTYWFDQSQKGSIFKNFLYVFFSISSLVSLILILKYLDRKF